MIKYNQWDRVENYTLIDSKSKLLAHRGYWRDPKKRNSNEALREALKLGYGLETDLRVNNYGQLIISHDPFIENSEKPVTFESLVSFYKDIESKGALALNIKCDGIHSLIKTILKHYKIDNYFLFDMSIPDLIAGISSGLEQFARASIYEDPESLEDICNGLWIDCFDNEYPKATDIKDLAKSWQKMALVSPELHGHNHLDFWREIKVLNQSEDYDLYLCTDFPDQAAAYFL